MLFGRLFSILPMKMADLVMRWNLIAILKIKTGAGANII